MIRNCPQFTVLEICDDDDVVSVRGRLTSVHGAHERWIKENWLGYLVNDTNFTKGRLYEADELWKFEIFKPEDNLKILTIGDTIAAVDGYWGRQAWMVLSPELE